MKRLKFNLSVLSLLITIGLFAQNNIKSQELWASNTYNLTLEFNSGGTLSQDNSVLANESTISVAENDKVTLKIKADAGYEVSTLTLGGLDVMTNLKNDTFTTMPITANSTLKVEFKIKQYRLLVKTGDVGGFILMCDYNSTPAFDITPPKGKTISSVLFNNEDITSSVEYGICTVPNITTNSTLVVTYGDVATSTKKTNLTIERVYSQHSNAIIENTSKGDIVNIISVLGKQISSIQSNGSTITVPLKKGMVYIIKTKLKSYKVVI